MTRIFDNIGADLGGHLRETVKVSDRMDAAVGYFNLRGWSLFAAEIGAKPLGADPIARVLVGMTLADPDSQVLRWLQEGLEGSEEADDIDGGVARARRDEALRKFRQQLMRGIPNNKDLAALRTLRKHLVEGRIVVKLFTRRPLHGKTYICHRQDINNPITGFVGSSNLTLAGLKHNYELNVDVLDTTAAADLAKWFEDRWADKFSIDITQALIDLIDESWASDTPRDPYEVYLKVCYHMSQDVRDGLAEFPLPKIMQEQLLEYQVSAVQTLARRIKTRGGTMLGDVVGLGKTIVAAATALMLRDEEGWSTLVICPKNLVKMWQKYFEAYDIPGRVLSYSMAQRDLPEMRLHRLVILDESHIMRNETRQDYQAIKNYIRDNGSHVLLLTATPYNLRFADVANQLALYIDEDDDLGLDPVAAIARDPGLVDKVDGKTNTLLAFRRSEEPDDWKRLMSSHLVRRTRSFIKKNYAQIDEHGREYLVFADGQPFYFPDRVAVPITHSFGKKDPALLMADPKTLDAIDALHLPRYDLAAYLDSKQKPNKAEKDLIDRLVRSHGHVLGFVRTGLYKRLSSAGYSFTLSLQRHVARNRLWIYAIENDLDVPVGTVIDPMLSSSDSDLDVDEQSFDPTDLAETDYAALRAKDPPKITWVRPSLFTADLLDRLRSDTETLEDLLDWYGEWTFARDSKLKALIKLLRDKHPNDKVLIFTEYKDTADYIAAGLDDAKITDVGLATGDTTDPTSVAKQFSPRSNRLPGEPEGELPEHEYRVLVATDVLSEGQNLQDAHIVVNYDLPWAIIRLIQRAGRVDRVGQKAAEVTVYSFWHDTVEQVLLLRTRIRARLEANAEVFGSDERFFGTAEETKEMRDFYDGHLDDIESDSDVDASSLAYEVWSSAEEEDPELAARVSAMPDNVDATRHAEEWSDEPTGVVCFVRTKNGTDGFGLADDDGSLRLITGHEALSAFACSPDTPALNRRTDHFDKTADLVRGPLAKPVNVEGKLRGVRRRVWNRLNGALIAGDPSVGEALDALFRRQLRREAETRLRTAMNNGVDVDTLGEMVARLHRDERLVVSDSREDDPVHIVCSMGIVE